MSNYLVMLSDRAHILTDSVSNTNPHISEDILASAASSWYILRQVAEERLQRSADVVLLHWSAFKSDDHTVNLGSYTESVK